MDPEDYSKLPLTQFEEDNVLREMNKSLLGFRQRRPPGSPTDSARSDSDPEGGPGTRRLSPIGESFSSASPEIETEDKSNLTKQNGDRGFFFEIFLQPESLKIEKVFFKNFSICSHVERDIGQRVAERDTNEA